MRLKSVLFVVGFSYITSNSLTSEERNNFEAALEIYLPKLSENSLKELSDGIAVVKGSDVRKNRALA